MTSGYLTDDEYRMAYGVVPRLCVDLVIRSQQGILLTRRKQEPHKGKWHLPGGRVRKGEALHNAAQRIAGKELGAQVEIGKYLGTMEFLVDPGDLVECHSVSVVLSCVLLQAHLPPDSLWFAGITTQDIHPVHKRFLRSIE